MARNKFERVDEVQPDAITLSLTRDGDREAGVVIPPASASGDADDYISGRTSAVDAFRSAIRLANKLKVAIVVIDPQGVWRSEWGDLFREEQDGEPGQ